MLYVSGMNDDLVKLPALSTRLKLPFVWLRDQADAGKIPFLPVPGRTKWIFSVGAVRSALAKQAAGSPDVEGSDDELGNSTKAEAAA